MGNYLIRDKKRFIDALRQLRILEYVNTEELQTLDDLFGQIDRSTLKEDILIKLQFYLILNLLVKSLPVKIGNELDDIKLDFKLDLVFGTDNAKKIKDYLYASNLNWKMPTSILKTSSFFLSLVVFASWVFAIFSFCILFPDIFIVTFNIFSISVLMLILIIPEIILRFLLPDKFGVEIFINIETLRDLLLDLNRINRHDYLKDSCTRMKDEMHILYGPF